MMDFPQKPISPSPQPPGCSDQVNNINLSADDDHAAIQSSSILANQTNQTSTTNRDSPIVAGGIKKAMRGAMHDNEPDTDNEKDHEMAFEQLSEVWTHGENLDTRRAQARRRLRHTKLYMELIEDRLLHLEDKVRELSGKPQESVEDEKTGEDLATISEIMALNWNDFRTRIEIDPKEFQQGWKHQMELDRTSKHMIEVLMEEPLFTVPQQDRGDSDTGGRSLAHRVDDDNTTAITPQISDECFEPYQIRIRSKLLLKILNKITGCETSIGPYKHKLLLFRPFKLLVSFEDDIRDKLRELEARCCGEYWALFAHLYIAVFSLEL
jgi:hypothetical protein